jgi:hypothetical protein
VAGRLGAGESNSSAAGTSARTSTSEKGGKQATSGLRVHCGGQVPEGREMNTHLMKSPAATPKKKSGTSLLRPMLPECLMFPRLEPEFSTYVM